MWRILLQTILKIFPINLATLNNKNFIATIIAVLFHGIGLIGILIFNSPLIIKSTPINLLLSAVLLIWTQQHKSLTFFTFLVLTIITGFAVEVIGVNTSLLFGNYNYGKVLGFKCLQVPLIIGFNWFIIMYCCGISTTTLLSKLMSKITIPAKAPLTTLKAISVITDAAALAVLFDLLIEPVAIKLGFWHWNGDGSIPLYNYICWIIISLILLTGFHFLRFNKQNKFAINLLLIQFMFFLLLRTFLK